MPLIFVEQREHLQQMIDVIFKSLAIYQYVIKEHNSTAVEEWLQCGIHGALEGAQRTQKTKGNYPELIMANMGRESCLMFLSFTQLDLMITRE